MRKREMTITKGRGSKQWRSWQSRFVADIVTLEGDDSRAIYILFIITALKVVSRQLMSTNARTIAAQNYDMNHFLILFAHLYSIIRCSIQLLRTIS